MALNALRGRPPPDAGLLSAACGRIVRLAERADAVQGGGGAGRAARGQPGRARGGGPGAGARGGRDGAGFDAQSVSMLALALGDAARDSGGAHAAAAREALRALAAAGARLAPRDFSPQAAVMLMRGFESTGGAVPCGALLRRLAAALDAQPPEAQAAASLALSATRWIRALPEEGGAPRAAEQLAALEAVLARAGRALRGTPPEALTPQALSMAALALAQPAARRVAGRGALAKLGRVLALAARGGAAAPGRAPPRAPVADAKSLGDVAMALAAWHAGEGLAWEGAVRPAPAVRLMRRVVALAGGLGGAGGAGSDAALRAALDGIRAGAEGVGGPAAGQAAVEAALGGAVLERAGAGALPLLVRQLASLHSARAREARAAAARVTADAARGAEPLPPAVLAAAAALLAPPVAARGAPAAAAAGGEAARAAGAIDFEGPGAGAWLALASACARSGPAQAGQLAAGEAAGALAACGRAAGAGGADAEGVRAVVAWLIESAPPVAAWTPALLAAGVGAAGRAHLLVSDGARDASEDGAWGERARGGGGEGERAPEGGTAAQVLAAAAAALEPRGAALSAAQLTTCVGALPAALGSEAAAPPLPRTNRTCLVPPPPH